jgi:hypothetical protein
MTPHAGPRLWTCVRFLGSIDVADAASAAGRATAIGCGNRFFGGYRSGLSNSEHGQPREPDIVRELRRQAPITRAAYLAWGESQMQPMDDAQSTAFSQECSALERLVRGRKAGGRTLAPGYFAVKRAGWLHMGVGSATVTEVCWSEWKAPRPIRMMTCYSKEKKTVSLDGVACLERPPTTPARRVIAGAKQLGRWKTRQSWWSHPRRWCPRLPIAQTAGWTGGCQLGADLSGGSSERSPIGRRCWRHRL